MDFSDRHLFGVPTIEQAPAQVAEPERTQAIVRKNRAPAATREDFLKRKAEMEAAAQAQDQDPVNPPGVTPKAAGSGLSEAEENFRKQLERATLQTGVLMPETEWDAALQNFTKTKLYQDLQGQQDNFRDTLSMAATHGGGGEVDLTPAMSLANMMRTGEYGTNYKAPHKEDAMKTVLAYADKLGDNQRDIYKTAVDAVKAQKYGQMTETAGLEGMLKEILHAQDPKMGAGGGRGDQNRDSKWVYQQFAQSPRTKDALKSLSELGKAEALMAKNDWLTKAALPGFIASSAGERPLSNNDIRRYSVDPAAVPMLEQALETLLNGRLTKAHYNDYKELLRINKQRQLDELKDQEDYFSTNVAPQVGVHPAEARKMLNISAFMGKSADNRGAAGGPAPKGTGDMVRVKKPDGTVGRIPRANLEKAKKAGYVEVK